MAVIDYMSGCLEGGIATAMRILGVFLSVGLYCLLTLHVYAYFHVIASVLKKRLGVPFGLLWFAIGLTLVYNIAFNHFFAMTIKPGSPKDLQRVEKKRNENKKRKHRKAVKVSIEDKSTEKEDDRFSDL